MTNANTGPPTRPFPPDPSDPDPYPAPPTHPFPVDPQAPKPTPKPPPEPEPPAHGVR